MSVRPAAAPDVAEIVDLERVCFPDPWAADSIRSELAAESRIARVHVRGGAADGKAVVGWAVVMVGGDVADLLRIGVLPPARRTGAARELLAQVTTESVARGAQRMLLEVAEDNAAARAFYAAAGFDEISRRRGYYPGGVDALVLARELT